MAAKCPMEERPVVDFNHESPDHACNWMANFSRLREEHPVAWTNEHGGFWVVSTYADCARIARDQETFTSEKTLDPVTREARGGILIPLNPGIRSIPIESGLAEWKVFRDILNPHFAPAAVERRRRTIEGFADMLIDRVIETGKVDLVNDLVSPLPAMIILDVLGLPVDEWKWWAEPFHEMVYSVKGSPEFMKSIKTRDEILARLDGEITKRRTHPSNDLLSILVQSQPYGGPLPNETILNVAYLILVAGSDTSTALASNTLFYLHQNHAARRSLIEKPESLDRAREEMLRYFSPVQTMARTVTKDVVVGGQAMKPGERVLLTYSSANHDTKIFEDPEKVNLERFPNPHFGFGIGIHRCLGSFLAKLSFNTVIGKVLQRMPDYRIDEAASRRYTSIASINGWIDMPATFTPGTRVAGGVQ